MEGICSTAKFSKPSGLPDQMTSVITHHTIEDFSCRAAIKASPNQFVASTLTGNLGALLMSGGRMQEALDQLDDCIAVSATLGEQAASSVAGIARHTWTEFIQSCQ